MRYQECKFCGTIHINPEYVCDDELNYHEDQAEIAIQEYLEWVRQMEEEGMAGEYY